MNNKPEHPMQNDPDALIRTALKTMRIPVDKGRLRRAFLKEVRSRRYGPMVRLAGWLSSPSAAFAGAMAYALLVCLYVGNAVSHQPLQQSELGWYSTLRLSLGQPVLFENGKTLLLEDGSELTCLDSTILAISFTDSQRCIALKKGTLDIHVGRDLQRQFVAVVGKTRVIATGTRFVVSTTPIPREEEVEP